jgi:PAS domain S-box-containing protein
MNLDTKTLKQLPKTILLELDEQNNIIECTGKLSDTKSIINKNIKDIFNFDSYKKLTDLLNFKETTVTIQCHTKEYEVQLIQNSNQRDILYMYDVTKYSDIQMQLKRSLHDLTSKKEELQAVFDLAANGISILDKNGVFLYANKFFQDMIEYSMEELYSQSCISLSSKEYAKSSQTAVQQAIEKGSIQNFKKVCITKSGKKINASMSLSYLKSKDEIVMITSDITQDIKYQDELKKQVELEVAKRAEQYEIMCHQSRLAAMGEMIDSIAHQWRQPLNGLGIIVQGLRHLSSQENFDFELLKEIETEIMEKITFMSQTIDDFSTFFRITKKKEKFNILTNINDAIRLIDVQLKASQIKININSKENNNLEVFGFANEFRQVMLNMIHNAMTAITQTKQHKGQISILLQADIEKITISIQDNGGGIKDKYLNKIFDPYFTTKDKGSGIGLYMSKVIIEHHMNGRLNVKNTHDGVQFTIILQKGQ